MSIFFPPNTDEANYAWVIDKDCLAEPGAEPGSWAGNAATVRGPGNAPKRLLDMLDAGKGRKFRMYDDDGERYYEGRILVLDPDTGELDDELGEDHFGPLTDFGTPNAGAAEIRYFGQANKYQERGWQML